MLTFALILAGGVAALLGAQKLDIEYTNPAQHRKSPVSRKAGYPVALPATR